MRLKVEIMEIANTKKKIPKNESGLTEEIFADILHRLKSGRNVEIKLGEDSSKPTIEFFRQHFLVRVKKFGLAVKTQANYEKCILTIWAK